MQQELVFLEVATRLNRLICKWNSDFLVKVKERIVPLYESAIERLKYLGSSDLRFCWKDVHWLFYFRKRK